MTNRFSVPPCSSFPTSFATENERLNCLIYASELCMNPPRLLTFKWPRQADITAAPQRGTRRREETQGEIIKILFFSLLERPKYTLILKNWNGLFYRKLKSKSTDESVSAVRLPRCAQRQKNAPFRQRLMTTFSTMTFLKIKYQYCSLTKDRHLISFNTNCNSGW